MKKLILAAAFVVAATSASLAQGYYGPQYGRGYYDFAPGYSQGYYGNSARDDMRGGPGPNVGPGSGMGIGSQR